jgi:hypothetical protein
MKNIDRLKIGDTIGMQKHRSPFGGRCFCAIIIIKITCKIKES